VACISSQGLVFLNSKLTFPSLVGMTASLTLGSNPIWSTGTPGPQLLSEQFGSGTASVAILSALTLYSAEAVKTFFMYFISHQKGVVGTHNGRIALTVGFVKPTNFTYKITVCGTNEESHQGQKLKSFAMQETQHNQATF
jgi:hypothetical protein